MNKEAKKVVNFILEKQITDPNWWNKESNISNVQTIINAACNREWDLGFKAGYKAHKYGGHFDE